MGEAVSKPSELLLGRKTYEIFADHWPYAEEKPAADEFNKAKNMLFKKS
jgi:dihydrofolate reductase